MMPMRKTVKSFDDIDAPKTAKILGFQDLEVLEFCMNWIQI
jgi:hypothetical protein